jgi:hypothetical protein
MQDYTFSENSNIGWLIKSNIEYLKEYGPVSTLYLIDKVSNETKKIEVGITFVDTSPETLHLLWKTNS